MHEFYYMGIGDRIKKKRTELNMTQEMLAKGICSNTYISKIENQKTKAKTAPLNLIMERMDMDYKKIGFPEELIADLEKSVEYFYYKNIEKYKELFKKIENFEFGILASVIRLGYYVLIDDFDNASPIYNEMFRYLNILENYGLSVFFIYASFFNLGINDLTSARTIIEMTRGTIQNDERIIALYSHLCYAVYGELGISAISPMTGTIAYEIYLDTHNFSRLNDLSLYNSLFKAYISGEDKVVLSTEFLSRLTPNHKNKLLFSLIIKENNPVKYVDLLDKKGDYYLEGLFFKAKFYLLNEEKEAYKAVKKNINSLHYELKSEIDYVSLLKLSESKQELFRKDFLINRVLPYTLKKQNIQSIKAVLDEIVKILKSKNRYKDALAYQEKKETILKELQYYEK